MSLLGLFPGYILLQIYLYIVGGIAWKAGYTNFLFDAGYLILVFLQIPIYAFIGFLLGIFHEYYGTESK